MLKVEIAVAEAQMKNHVIPETNLEPLKIVLKSGIDEPRMREIEKETKHDIMAFIRTVEEQSNHAFKFLISVPIFSQVIAMFPSISMNSTYLSLSTS